jgi:DNA-binding response OmpR family regulator
MKKILVVEDDNKIVAALTIRLKAAGYEVLTASDGFEGLNLAISIRPDLIISDIWMPVGIGFSMAGRLQELAPEIPVIFITAGREPGLEKAAKELGAVAFFEKPYDPAKLLATVAHALEDQAMNKKILVIDDDPKIVQVLQIRLKSAGYEVLTAVDGVSGLRLAMEGKPDLAILDIMMPLGGGFSVAHRLREQALDVPAIFITASKQPGLREMADNLGAVGFIEKPHENEELLAAVAKALETKPASPAGRPDTAKPPVTASAMATPASNSPVSHPNTPGRPARITGKNKILIVEDDRKIAMALALRLRATGQDVLLAYDALAGLDSAIKHQPDLVLLDIGLPAGSGLVVAERIQNLVPKYTPIIFLTASRQPGLRDQALALGAVGFLEKPFESEELMATIQNALNPAGDPALAPEGKV